MMLTLNDGRTELWQWDTGRTLAVDADCSQVHFSNKVFGRSIDVDVVDGVAVIPDILLQADNDLNVWAFVGTAENGYTKISKAFKVNRRNKPADYVFTPIEQTTIDEIAAIAQSVRDDADAGLFDGKPGENGRDGVDGKDGAPGKDGTDGKDGYTPKKGVDYFDGEPGQPGEKGEPFTYSDFTPEQLEALRGPQGIPGPAGSDANVTSKNIESALGFTPADSVALSMKQDKPVIKTAMGEISVSGAQYYLGEQSSVSVVLPDDAEIGQMVTVSWYNGVTAATLSITGTMLPFDYTPSANTRSEINALWDGTYWAVIGNEMEVPAE